MACYKMSSPQWLSLDNSKTAKKYHNNNNNNKHHNHYHMYYLFCRKITLWKVFSGITKTGQTCLQKWLTGKCLQSWVITSSVARFWGALVHTFVGGPQCSICQKTSGGRWSASTEGGAVQSVGCGEGVSPPQPTRGSGGASWALPAGSGAEPRPQTHFKHILGSQRGSGRRKNATFSAPHFQWDGWGPLNAGGALVHCTTCTTYCYTTGNHGDKPDWTCMIFSGTVFSLHPWCCLSWSTAGIMQLRD